MIELTVLDYLKSKLTVPVVMEEITDGSFVVIEKTSENVNNLISSATLAIQSYANSLYEAASLNEVVKEKMLGTDEEPGIEQLATVYGAELNSDYNFTDTTRKRYRYQAVYEIKF